MSEPVRELPQASRPPSVIGRAGVKVPVAGLRSSAVATARSVVFRHAVR